MDIQWPAPFTRESFRLQYHLLHGLIHSSGLGHLIKLNGVEGGSRILSGRQLMDLWDALCVALNTSAISVEDIAKKWMMELRIVYGLAYDHSWFGMWGYDFANGCFGVSKDDYQNALLRISNEELDQLVMEENSMDVANVICEYRELSSLPLVTLKHLLRYMLSLIPTSDDLEYVYCPPRPQGMCKTPPGKIISMSLRHIDFLLAGVGKSIWPQGQVIRAIKTVIEVLMKNRENGSFPAGMNRDEIREATRLSIGNTLLLDYVLRYFWDARVEEILVTVDCCPKSSKLVYKIGEFSESSMEELISNSASCSGFKVCKDLFKVYSYLKKQGRFSNEIELLVENRNFIKFFCEYPAAENMMKLNCRVEMEIGGFRELIFAPAQVTYGGLKSIVQEALRDTYYPLKDFNVTEVDIVDGLPDNEVFMRDADVSSGLADTVLISGSDVLNVEVRGENLGLESDMVFEGGNLVRVRCPCGATTMDGRRMVGCDICEQMQHPRCNGIEDSEQIPPTFICRNCIESLVTTVGVCGGSSRIKKSFKGSMLTF